MSAVPNRSDRDDRLTLKSSFRKPRIVRRSHPVISNTNLVYGVKKIAQMMADPLSTMILDLYLLKHSEDFEKYPDYLAHMEKALNAIRVAINELASMDQVNFNAQNDITSQE